MEVNWSIIVNDKFAGIWNEIILRSYMKDSLYNRHE
jgi:hypothetical protein